VSRTQQLLAHNAKVYLAARNAQKADEAIAELKNETGKEAIFLQLDLADIPAIRRSAQEFLSYGSYLLYSCHSHAFSGMRVNYTSLLTTRESCVVAEGVEFIRRLIDGLGGH
jgi:NAD(P)-dependent dehydrogenase (short-subunit alcohol dehydrogenase family)